MEIGKRILKKEKTISKELIEQFLNIPVANISDGAGRSAGMFGKIHAMNDVKIAGSAYTVKVPAGDNLLVYYAIEHAAPGDILVIDSEGYTNRAILGELMANWAKQRGLGGIVVNGAIRDLEEIKNLKIGVFACGVCPNGPEKNGPGEINVPVVMNGQVVNPGDLIVADQNGIVVVSNEDVSIVLDKAKAIQTKENHILSDILHGKDMDTTFVYQKLKELNMEEK